MSGAVNHARESLPQRRASLTFSFRHGPGQGQRFDATIGFYPDGRPGELFLSAGKSETDIETMARDLAVVTSIALQYGAPVETIERALTRLSNGAAAGPLGACFEAMRREMDAIDSEARGAAS